MRLEFKEGFPFQRIFGLLQILFATALGKHSAVRTQSSPCGSRLFSRQYRHGRCTSIQSQNKSLNKKIELSERPVTLNCRFFSFYSMFSHNSIFELINGIESQTNTVQTGRFNLESSFTPAVGFLQQSTLSALDLLCVATLSSRPHCICWSRLDFSCIFGSFTAIPLQHRLYC